MSLLDKLKFLNGLYYFKPMFDEMIYQHRKIGGLNNRFGCSINQKSFITFDDINTLKIGKNVIIGPYSVIYINDIAEVKNSRLEIGENTYIGDQNNIRAAGGEIIIGKNCLISQQVSIIASNHLTQKGINIQDQGWDTEKKGVTIGDDVWIGCSSQILPGVTIGNGAVIAAGSVVTKNVEANGIYVGSPAKLYNHRK